MINDKKKIRSKERWFFIGLLCLAIGTPFLFIGGTIVFFIGGIFASERPYRMYLKSMRTGDGEKAVYWGKHILVYAEQGYHSRQKLYGYTDNTQYTMCGISLASAYELNREYEKALESYKQFIEIDSDANMPRVLFKMGRYKDAFNEYYRLFEKSGEEYLEIEGYHQEKCLNQLYQVIMCPSHTYSGCPYLGPFKTFDEFYTFMEEEYLSRGSPKKYKKVMDIFLKIKLRSNEFSEKYKKIEL